MMWHDLSSAVGWTSWLLMALVMIVFWGVVSVGVWALLQISRRTDRDEPNASRSDQVSPSGAEAISGANSPSSAPISHRGIADRRQPR